jgi:hypothetical protein
MGFTDMTFCVGQKACGDTNVTCSTGGPPLQLDPLSSGFTLAVNGADQGGSYTNSIPCQVRRDDLVHSGTGKVGGPPRRLIHAKNRSVTTPLEALVPLSSYRLAPGKVGRVLEDLVNLTNDAGAVEENAGKREVGCAAYVDLGVIRSLNDPDICLLKPMPLDQDGVWVAR